MRQLLENFQALKCTDVRQVFINTMDESTIVKIFQNMQQNESFFEFSTKCNDNLLRKLIMVIFDFNDKLKVSTSQFEAQIERLYQQCAFLNKQLQDVDGIKSIEYPIDSRLDMIIKR